MKPFAERDGFSLGATVTCRVGERPGLECPEVRETKRRGNQTRKPSPLIVPVPVFLPTRNEYFSPLSSPGKSKW